MSFDPDFFEQAYHLFVEEALELLQQIQETLLELPDDPSLSKVYSLVRAASTIKSGATQVNLTDISNLSHRFEKIFRTLWQEKILVDSELEDLLWQTYAYLRQALLATLQINREETSAIFEQAKPIFERLEASIAQRQNAELDWEAIADSPEAGTEKLLNQEVVQALTNLETLLSHSQSEQFLAALTAQTEVFLSLGELLEVSEFVAIAQVTLATLQINPQTASIIGQLALVGFRGIWETTANNGLKPQISAIEPEARGDAKVFFQAYPEIAIAPPPESQRTFNTAKFLAWLAGTAVFMVKGDRVQEILIPQANQLVGAKGQQGLYWRDNRLPIYRLSELLVYNCLLPDRSNDAIFSSTPMLIVLERPRETIAIELSVDRLVGTSELVLKPFGSAISAPNYCVGCTTLEGDRLAVAIDLEGLLSETIDRTLKAIAASEITILALDDSSTSRQILVLTLQKAGYRVIQARDGEEGLRQLRQNPRIHLVISDIEMPKLNGFGFLKACRQNPQLAKVPVILLSSYNSDRHRQMATELGATAYLSKPFNEKKFLGAIDAIVSETY
jgi:chemotaxis protein histidine kinase CheA